MAKIGNEAKLILKLANERAEVKVTQVAKEFGNSDYYCGWRNATNWIVAEIAQICLDLEAGR